MLKRIFETQRDEITGEWRKLHKEELNDLYSAPNIIRVMGGACSAYGGEERRTQGCGGET